MTFCQVWKGSHVVDFDSAEEAQKYIDLLPSPKGILIEGGPLLFRLMNEVGAPAYNWREINQEICNQWDNLSATPHDELNFKRTVFVRESLLHTFHSVMNIAGTTVLADELPRFIEARRKQYSSFIFEESFVGGSVCVETLFEVTEREIAAGRMDEGHECRELAIKGMAFPHFTRAQMLRNLEANTDMTVATPVTMIQRIKRWLFSA